ncbi:MAG: hypothetical protein QXM68_01650 [Candidatus Aenigmatarchaeota archaeon]|nr:hypothetical protein [Candidatus Aenigmarchaeota archaeon]
MDQTEENYRKAIEGAKKKDDPFYDRLAQILEGYLNVYLSAETGKLPNKNEPCKNENASAGI